MGIAWLWRSTARSAGWLTENENIIRLNGIFSDGRRSGRLRDYARPKAAILEFTRSPCQRTGQAAPFWISLPAPGLNWLGFSSSPLSC
jgi:hypothetical protein